MWMMTTAGFFSVVEGKDGRLLVRARDPADLKRLRKIIPELSKPTITPRRDYRYRSTVDREPFAQGVAELVRGIDYFNFKDEAYKVTPEHEKLYHKVWSIMGKLQPGGPYGYGGGKPIPKTEGRIR